MRFQCVKDHPENTRWGQGCGADFTMRAGSETQCPLCGAVYVRIKEAERFLIHKDQQ